MEREYKFICDNCSSEFTIITEEKEEPENCPFCGEYLEEALDEDDT